MGFACEKSKVTLGIPDRLFFIYKGMGEKLFQLYFCPVALLRPMHCNHVQ